MAQVQGKYGTDLTKINDSIEQMNQGRLNCSGTFTLDTGATSTVVNAPTVASGTRITFSPTSADAAAAMPTTYILDSNVSAGSFIVSHATSGATDLSFSFIAIG